MSLDGMTAWGRGHAVGFYALDGEGIDAVARFVADGWDLDECVVVVATAQHRAAVAELLTGRGYDPVARTDDGRYIALDAADTLQQVMVDGRLDPDLFLARAGEVIGQASSAGVPVRAFGEMVSQLWQNGLVEPAIELELMWNQLLRQHDFTLLCAYPTGAFEHAQLVDVRRVCELHTDLLPPSAVWEEGGVVEAGHACSRVYLPTPESVPAARHFVVDVLRAWGHAGLAPDAALIVSELATNALRHAGSPFRAVVDRRRGGLRVGVEDTTDTPLQRRDITIDDVNGRGAHIVEALSERWGSSPLPGGKVVWAELPLESGPAHVG
ncbi:MEDS domain-containing protein [Terrabacter terrigena]|uniref:MEDS domain-containing protein n=1 Tax=Terrabacter terrigena TaxID=574718 RepID=A0ABW3MWW3_9MICO